MKNYTIAGHTDTGRVRDVNEDYMAAFDSPNGQVIVVCDGMGGQNAGDVASRLAVTVIRDILCDNTFASPEEAITRSVMAANQAILNRAATNPNLSGMGSTCIILIIKDGKVYYGSVGDSRIYYIAGGSIVQVTRDQSYVQSLVDAGEITQEEAEHHQDKNQITNALGIESMTPPVLSPSPVSPETGGIFLLCSDGLSNMLSQDEILNIVSRPGLPLQQRAEALVEKANEAGGSDNITVQLVEFSNSAAGTALPAGEKNMVKEIKRNRRLSYILGILTLIVLAGGGVAWYLTDMKPDEPSATNTTKAPTTTTVTPTAPKQENTKVVKKVVIEEEIVEVPGKPAKQKKTETKKESNTLNNKAVKKVTEKNPQPSPAQKIEEAIDNAKQPEMRTADKPLGKDD